ncbi:MAG: helix-turn-helix transcriptional regulator [Clostridia bacterium]|nr:helix-turn-helix transcriptional regulator [Clostridia bacterium]
MNAEYEKEIGGKIRFYREKKKMTQELLSAKLQLEGCDITRSALAKIEVGQRHIYIDELKALVKLLGIKYEDLL